jgi:GNAT superfamily N-acetyltransferase
MVRGDKYFYRVRFFVEHFLENFDEYGFHTTVEGRILATEYHTEDIITVGSLTGTIYALNEADAAGWSSFEVFDCIGPEAFEVFLEMTKDEGKEWREEVNPFEHGDGHVFVIERMGLDPAHRGQGVAAKAVKRMCALFAKGLTVLQRVPLRYTAEEEFEPYEGEDEEEAKESLEAFWRSVGFERLEGTDTLMYSWDAGQPDFDFYEDEEEDNEDG